MFLKDDPMETPKTYNVPPLDEGNVMMFLLRNSGDVPVIASMIERGKIMEWLLKRFKEVQ